jgi:hypothetical protein
VLSLDGEEDDVLLLTVVEVLSVLELDKLVVFVLDVVDVSV